jgi:hypothetical protein
MPNELDSLPSNALSIAERLVALPAWDSAPVSRLVPMMDGYEAGFVLRRLRDLNLARTTNQNATAPKKWAATETLRWLMMKRSEASLSQYQLQLPAPPSADDPRRFERIGSFAGLGEALRFFEGRMWSVHVNSGVSLFMIARAESVEEDRRTDPAHHRHDQEWLVLFTGGSLLCFSRRAFRGAVFDRTMQELTVRQENGSDVNIEFVPDGIDE